MIDRHPHADVIHAWAEGAEVEVFDPAMSRWCGVTHPVFSLNKQYRVKPSPQLPLPLDEQTDDAGGVCTVC